MDVPKVTSKFRDAEQNTRHKWLRYLTFWKHLICISVLRSQMVRFPGENWCHVCLPQSEWIQHDTQNIRLQRTQAESLHIVFTVCTTSKQLLCATWISHLILYKNNVCVKYCIWVMPGSNLDRDIDYPKYFSWTFSAPLQANSGIVPTMRSCLLPSTSFTIHFHHTFIWGLYCTSSVAYTVMKYKQQRQNSISDDARLVNVHKSTQHNIPEDDGIPRWETFTLWTFPTCHFYFLLSIGRWTKYIGWTNSKLQRNKPLNTF